MEEGISEGIGQGPEETCIVVKNPIDSHKELEDQPVGEHEEPQEGLTSTEHAVNASGRVSKPPAHLIEEMGETALMAAK